MTPEGPGADESEEGPVHVPFDDAPAVEEPLPEPDPEVLSTDAAAIVEDLKAAFREEPSPLSDPSESFLEERFFDLSYLDDYPEVSRKWVNPPYAYVSVVFDPENEEYRYHVGEPVLDEFERYVREDLEGSLRDVLMYEEFEPGVEAHDAVETGVVELLEEYGDRVDAGTLHKLFYYLRRDFAEEGKVDPVMRDPDVEDISCVGTDIPVFIYHHSYRDLRSNVSFTRDRLTSFITRLAARAGRHISTRNPMLDATMPGGARIQLTLGEDVSTRGSNFTIRKFADVPRTPVDLIRWNTFSLDELAYLWLAIQNDMSMLFAGGTASGKTTSMNAAGFFIPPNSKVISIEDTREITLPHDNWIQSVSRQGFGGDEAFEIDARQLLQAGLRQRPEYLLVGEIRTEAEVALTFFQAISTGHTGYSTFHADSVETVLDRLQNPPLSVPSQMIRSLDIVCVQKQQYIDHQRLRRNTEIVELRRGEEGGITRNQVFRWNPAEDTHERVGESRVFEHIKTARGWDDERIQSEYDRRREVLRYLVDNDIREYQAVTDVLYAFARRPDTVIERIREASPTPDELA